MSEQTTRIKIIVTVIDGAYEESAEYENRLDFGTYASDALELNTIVGDIEQWLRQHINDAIENDKV